MLHPYQYAQDDPVNNLDPTGLLAVSNPVGGGYMQVNTSNGRLPGSTQINGVSFSGGGQDLQTAGGSGHAEAQVLAYMEGHGIDPYAIAAGRPICPERAADIQAAGAWAATELRG